MYGRFALPDAELSRCGPDGAARVAERLAYETSRTRKEHESFTQAIRETMDLWYGHAATTVVLHTALPPSASVDATRTYEARGWTTFERCSAELAKAFKLSAARWALVLDTADQVHAPALELPPTTNIT